MVEGAGELLAAAAEGAPVENSYWEFLNLNGKMEGERSTNGDFIAKMAFAFLYLSLLEAVGTQRAGAVVAHVPLDIDYICSRSLHTHHIEPLPCQVVTWHKRGFLALWN